MNDSKKADKNLADDIQKITEGMVALHNALISVISKLIEIAKPITTMYCFAFSNNSKVKHLALHSKKARVRKKNIHRLQREVMR